MRNKLLIAVAGAMLAFSASAQEQPLDPHNAVKFTLPPDSPVTLLGLNLNESRATVRGGAVVLDLHMDVTMRNSAQRRVRGVTMFVVAQESSPFGRASVSRLVDVGPGENFPMRVDVRLIRPYPATDRLIQVNLDGVIFDDLNFYGPNRLNSKRTMTAWEMEARRDRQYFKQALASRGVSGLQDAVEASLVRQHDMQRLDARLDRGRTSSASATPGRIEQFAFLASPDAPVKALKGFAELSGDELRSPHIDVENRSGKPVRYVEIAWTVKDREGKQYRAGSAPGATGDIYLPPGRRGQVIDDTTLRFPHSVSAAPLAIDKIIGMVKEVEFADGKVWIPSQRAETLPPSPEEQRLTDLCRKRGVQALIQELAKF